MLPLCLFVSECELLPRSPKGGRTVGRGAGGAPQHAVSKANFQSHSRALISHHEVASVASGLHVVMDTKAWDPRDGGERGAAAAPSIGFLSAGPDGWH